MSGTKKRKRETDRQIDRQLDRPTVRQSGETEKMIPSFFFSISYNFLDHTEYNLEI